MSAVILDGTKAAAAWLDEIKPTVAKLDPKLVVIQVGNDPASSSYIKKKVQSCAAVGMRSEHLHLPESITAEELFAEIEKLNADADVSGFFVQLPLPSHLQPLVPQITRAIDPKKDIDGFGAYNLGKMFLSPDFEHLPPATPAGIIRLLEHYDISVAGKHIVVIGRSNTVGKPVATMLTNRDATVTICHRKTPDITVFTKEADMIITAVGRAHMITADLVKPGAVLIDVGMSQTEDGLKGDVDFDNLVEVASAITPMPGGVGPMTVASLLNNCVSAKKRQLEA